MGTRLTIFCSRLIYHHACTIRFVARALMYSLYIDKSMCLYIYFDRTNRLTTELVNFILLQK